MKLVIDLGALLHDMRRWWWRWSEKKGFLLRWRWDPRKPSPLGRRCFDCGATLTKEEREYYESTCEMCEGAAMRVGDGA